MKLSGDLYRRGLLREECGYFILRQMMPYPLGESNSFIIENSPGWAVIDVGVDIPSTREVWELALKEIGISFKDISSIYITHCHPDHLGAARWLQQMCEAPVFMLAEEIQRANSFLYFDSDFAVNYRKAIEPECQRQSFAPEMVAELVRSWSDEVGPLFPQPEVMLPLEDNQKIELRGEKFTIIPAPIHADGQFLLWNSQINHLFCADLLAADAYIHFSDWPHTRRPNSLELLFKSIEQLSTLGQPLVFPGHGGSFTDLPQRLKSLHSKHLKRLDKIEAKVRDKATAADVYPQVYDLFDYVHLHRCVLGETLGYLEYLCLTGRLLKNDQGDRVIFRR